MNPAALMQTVTQVVGEGGEEGQIPAGLGIAMALVLGVAGLVVVVLARRGMDGRLGRNRLAGIRTSATLASDEAWHEGQRVGGPLTLAGGAMMMVAAVPLLFTPSENAAAAIVLVGVCISTGLVAWGGIKGHRAAAAVDD